MGRTDEQVKIRGFRIEPGEIESVLAGHASMSTAAVLARENEQGVKRLIAYIVAREEAGIDLDEVRTFLKAKLPDYMVPAAIVELPALPLNANGKLDRQALPMPTFSSDFQESQRPTTPAEIELARVWSQVLGVKDIGVNDNFFDLGGDSIQCIQICARATRAGWQINPRQMFERQTVAGLAAVAQPSAATSAAKTDACGPIPLLPIQRWFFEQDVPDAHHFNQAVMLTVDARVSASAIERALVAVVAHHDGLRTQFTKSADGWSARIGPPQTGESVLNRVVLSGEDARAPAAAVGRAGAALQASLDLQDGHLLRATFFEGSSSHRLLIVVHHLVVDTVSWRIMLEDLESSCAQAMAGEPIVLPPKTTSLRGWARRLTAHADSPALDDARAWWRSAALRPVVRLPVDHPGRLSGNTVGSAAKVSVSLSAAETEALVQAVPRTYRTQINDVLLTALLQSTAPWTGSSSLVVDLEGHGREPVFDDLDLTRTVGWFTTVAPLQLRLPAQGNAADALLAVKEQLRSVGGGLLNYGLLRYCSTRSLAERHAV